jgi:ABC-type lipoprotein release transport system permease subunit
MRAFNSAGWLILWPIFRYDFMRILLVLTLVLSVVAVLISMLALYEEQLESSLASKQPHIVVQPISDEMTESEARLWIEKINQQVHEVTSITPYLTSIRFITWHAQLMLPGDFRIQAYSKHAMVNTTVVGVDKSPPAIMKLLADKAYVSGEFRLPLTPLEQMAAWYTNEDSAIMNRVLDNSFYPPISQAVILTTKANDITFSFHVSQPITDYKNNAVLYTGLKKAQQLLSNGNRNVTGVYINIALPKQAAVVSNRLREFMQQQGESVRISTWLDSALKQQQLVTLLRLVVTTLSVIVTGLGMLLVLLTEYKSVVAKHDSLSIFFRLGLISDYYICSGLVIAVCTAACVAQSIAYLTGIFAIQNLSVFSGSQNSMSSIIRLLCLIIIFSVSSWFTVRAAVREDAVVS